MDWRNAFAFAVEVASATLRFQEFIFLIDPLLFHRSQSLGDRRLDIGECFFGVS